MAHAVTRFGARVNPETDNHKALADNRPREVNDFHVTAETGRDRLSAELVHEWHSQTRLFTPTPSPQLREALNLIKLLGERTHVINIPATYHDVISFQWEDTMDKETENLDDHENHDLVLVTSGREGQKFIVSRFVLKEDANGTLHTHFIRVVQGRFEEPYIDYGESFAPACKVGGERMLLATTCKNGWPSFQPALLQRKIDDDIFINPSRT